MRNRIKRFSFGTCAFIALLAGAGKLGLASDFAIQQLLTRIQVAVGAPVRVAAADLGYSSSSLSGLEVLENTSDGPPPWTATRAIETDLSLWQLLRGDLGAGTVTFRDTAVTLRFDRNNFLLTRLPTPPPSSVEWPLIRLFGGTFTLQHEGVPDEVFHNIRLELRGDSEKLKISGTVDDPDWGEWTVTGGRSSATDVFTMTLRTVNEVHVTPALLKRAPFVPLATWQAVELEGDTTCEVTLRFELDGRVHYRVVLDPHNTKVHVPCIALRAESAHGRVIFEDNVLTLENVQGLSAGGDLKVGSTMDFRSGASLLRFDIDAVGMNPRLLPKTWNAPAVEGQVSGRAELDVLIRDGVTTTGGRGEGSVKVLPFLPPINLHLKPGPEGRGFVIGLGKL